ncbi:MAG: TMEM175 family protein [Methanolinea sp.]|jgi:uncharacterized membrane protein|nr:TMEM175 family protein [Methanolinea sp.]
MPENAVPPLEKIGKSRLEALSDGIFAFAMTLLVISLAIPEIPYQQAPAILPGKLADMAPEFMLFVIAFFILAGYWISHHHILEHVRYVDGVLVRINIILLFFIVLIPFTTSISGDYTNVLEAVLFFHVNLLVASLTLTGMWWYIRRHSAALAPEIPVTYKRGAEKAIVMPGVILLAIGVSFINTHASMWCYALIPVIFFMIGAFLHLKAVKGSGDRRIP